MHMFKRVHTSVDDQILNPIASGSIMTASSLFFDCSIILFLTLYTNQQNIGIFNAFIEIVVIAIHSWAV